MSKVDAKSNLFQARKKVREILELCRPVAIEGTDNAYLVTMTTGLLSEYLLAAQYQQGGDNDKAVKKLCAAKSRLDVIVKVTHENIDKQSRDQTFDDADFEENFS